jgi:hypothetical protein
LTLAYIRVHILYRRQSVTGRHFGVSQGVVLNC